jgi:ATP-binding cassette subfamily F protein 3
MLLLSVSHLRKQFGPETTVLEDVSFQVHQGDKIGLIGPNGTGKTTLLNLLVGREEAEAGAIETSGEVRVGYLLQRPVLEPGSTLRQEARKALEDLLRMQKEAENLARAMAESSGGREREKIARRYDRLHEELLRRDAYHVDHKIESVLQGLGFPEATFDMPAENLSGGELNRLSLAQLLLAEPEILLMDEPSNHLDLRSTEWLEEYLAGIQASVIVVSHDRYFLDKVTNRIFELFQGTVDEYSGNFSAYLSQKEQRLLVQTRTWEKQREEIEKAEEFIRRNRYGQKHAQAEDRKKKLERIEPVPPPRDIRQPPMHFSEPARSGDIVFRFEHLSKGYREPLFEDLTFDVMRGERWAVIGPNGCGKTTLLRCLLGQEPPDGGAVHFGHGVKIGYFDQHLETLDDRQSILEAVRPQGQLMPEEQRRGLLARFGLTGDMVFKEIGFLSGGERCRVALACLAAETANVLVLDEPTNHLDLWARRALEKALKAFSGTVLFISHDRFFVDQVADHLLVMQPDARFRVLEGNYTLFHHMMEKNLIADPFEEAPSEQVVAAKEEKKVRIEQKEQTKKVERPRKKRRFPYRKVDSLESEIFEKETRLEHLQHELIQPETQKNGERVRDVQEEIDQLEDDLAFLYEHWEEATELNW